MGLGHRFLQNSSENSEPERGVAVQRSPVGVITAPRGNPHSSLRNKRASADPQERPGAGKAEEAAAVK